MKLRLVTGEERETLLGSRQAAAFDYRPYLEAINAADNDEVIAVEIDGGDHRGEKIRFARAARIANKSLRWLANPERE